jgi:excisionase family DNA binding protein
MSEEKFELVLLRLSNIESALADLTRQRMVKEFYSTAEVSELLARSDYTIREWCRKGQAMAVKSPNGRGWLISHDELTRLRNEGPLPEQQSKRMLHR